MIKEVHHVHLSPIWYHSEPSDVPYSKNQFLGWDFFCRFLQQESSSLVSTSQLFALIGISDCVLGAGFSSLTFDAKSSKGNNSPKDFTLSTSPMLATLEKLKKNDEIWISVGRKKRGSSLAISMGQPAILNVKMLAEDKIEEEKLFE